MEIYIIKSGGIMLFILAVYYLLLRQETFYRNNRFYLLAGLVLSVVLPLITITRIKWVEAVEVPVKPLHSAIQVFSPQIQPEITVIDWSQIIMWIYMGGVIAFSVKFLLDFIDLRKTLRGQPVIRSGKFKIVETSENVSPFSYFNYIVYNPDLYSKVELANIIEHEKVHCNQVHSFDVIVSRIYCILFWFNPFAWLYKKTIIQNLEFIADNEASGKISDRLSYQITLVKVTAHENCVAITNHFYQSLIKKRIVMLNKNRSNRANQWKYGIVFPALTAFMLQFQVDVVAQSKPAAKKDDHVVKVSYSEDSNARIDGFVILPSTTDKELKSYEEMLRKQYGMEMKFSNILRNKKKEILRFDFWYDDKVNKPKTLKVAVKKPDDLFFMVDMKKDASGKNRLNVNTYNRNEPQAYTVKADTLIWHSTTTLTKAETEAKKKNKNMLIIIGDKQYMANDLINGSFILEVEGSITTLSPEEGIALYGQRAKEGVMIVNGKAEIVPKQKTPTEFPKVVTLENGDQVVFMKDGQMKLPGHPTVTFDKDAILSINDVVYDNGTSIIANMDLERIKSIQFNESKNASGVKTTKIEMKLKQ